MNLLEGFTGTHCTAVCGSQTFMAFASAMLGAAGGVAATVAQGTDHIAHGLSTGAQSASELSK